MIKASDRKTTRSESVCYEESSEPALGIAFEKRDGTRRFAPYAFLSAVDYDGKGEVTFHFSIGLIIARGESLDPLWRAACNGQLVRVCECDKPSASETTWVRELDFSDVNQEPQLNLPPLPNAP